MIREKNWVLNAVEAWGSCNPQISKPPPPQRVQGMPMLGDMENSIFTAQKAIDWLIYSFVT